jgi:hypothetical protein
MPFVLLSLGGFDIAHRGHLDENNMYRLGRIDAVIIKTWIRDAVDGISRRGNNHF